MDNTSIFDAALSRAQKTAQGFGTEMLSGKDAFENSATQRPPQDPERTRFQDGDEFTVPATKDDPHWVAVAMRNAGKPVTRLLAEVDRQGKKVIIDTFCGTFLKAGPTPDGGTFRSTTILKDGTDLADLALTCASAAEIWTILFGRRFKVSNAREVQARRYTNDGQCITRATWTYTFTEI